MYTNFFSKKIGIFSKYCRSYCIRHFEFSKSDISRQNRIRFVISEPKNPYIPIFSKKIVIFSKCYRPYWIRHFEIWKSDGRFVISALKIPENALLWIIEHHKSKMNYTNLIPSARKIMYDCCFPKSTIFKKKIGKKLTSIFSKYNY